MELCLRCRARGGRRLGFLRLVRLVYVVLSSFSGGLCDASLWRSEIAPMGERQQVLRRAVDKKCVCDEDEWWTGSNCTRCILYRCAGGADMKPDHASFIYGTKLSGDPSNATCEWLCVAGYEEENGTCVSCSCPAGRYRPSCGYEKVELAMSAPAQAGPVAWYQFDEGDGLDSGAACFAMESSNVVFTSEDSRSARVGLGSQNVWA